MRRAALLRGGGAEASALDGEAGFFRGEAVEVRVAAEGADDALAVGREVGVALAKDDALEAAGGLGAEERGAAVDDDAAVFERVGERVGDVGIAAGEELRAALDDGDL